MEFGEDTIVLVVVSDEEKSPGNYECGTAQETDFGAMYQNKGLTDDTEVTKLEEFVKIKEESDDIQSQYLVDEALQITTEIITEEDEKTCEFIETEVRHDGEKNYLIDDEVSFKGHIKSSYRRRMLRPYERKSYIAILREKFKQLEDDELLIDTLEQMMRDLRPPPLPTDFSIEKTDGTYRCSFCGALSATHPAATRHYYEKHGPRYLRCYACGVDFRSKWNLHKHEMRCTAPDAHLILKARAQSLGGKARNRPYLGRVVPKPSRRFHCSMCSGSFNWLHSLQAHENLHRGARPYRCHICPNAYTSPHGLNRHLRRHTDQQYVCDHCGRSFKTRSIIITHMDTHRPVRRFGCSECDRRFAQKRALDNHVLRVHKKLPYPFACELCPKRYPRMTLLKEHMKKQHGLTIITQRMFANSLPSQSNLELLPMKVVLKTEINDGD